MEKNSDAKLYGLTALRLCKFDKRGRRKEMFTIADYSGNIVDSRFTYTKPQIEAIFRFMRDGIFEGMFNINSKEAYLSALVTQYGEIIKACDTENEEERFNMQSEKLAEFTEKVEQLDEYQKEAQAISQKTMQ